MKSNLLWLLGGGGLVYLLVSSRSANAAQTQIQSTNLTAGTSVANAQLLANAATNIANDVNILGVSW